MDERIKELVAMGASAAANCHPCNLFEGKYGVRASEIIYQTAKAN